jgi:Ca2+-binding RTX toxin-like protein
MKLQHAIRRRKTRFFRAPRRASSRAAEGNPLVIEPLEERVLLSILTFDAAEHGVTDYTLRIARNKYEIVDSGSNVLESSPLNPTTAVAITGDATGDDSFTIAPSFFSNLIPVSFAPGGGLDTIAAQADDDFTLTDATLTSAGGLKVSIGSSLEAAHLRGGNGDNTLDASGFTGGGVTLVGGNGDDTLVGGDGADSLDGGNGNDSLVGGDGDDTLLGGNGNDTMVPGLGDDFSDGGNGNNLLIWQPGSTDTYQGGMEDDTIEVGSGMMMPMGGALAVVGQLEAEPPGAGVVANLGETGAAGQTGLVKQDADGDGEFDHYLILKGPIDGFIATEFADIIHGNDLNNSLFGLGGDDVITAGNGNDMIVPGQGNDTASSAGATGSKLYIWEPGSTDTYQGGMEDDTIDVGSGMMMPMGLALSPGSEPTCTGVHADLDQPGPDGQTGLVTDDQGNVLILYDDLIENINSTDCDDTIFGNSEDNIINARGGNDEVQGRDGDDLIRGGDGDDSILGQSGNDVLVGGAGDDRLNGGSGRDIVIGGDGSDVIKAGADQDIVITGFTDHDDDDAALLAILDEWTSNKSFEERVNNVMTGGGLTGGFAFNSTTVHDDGDQDTATAGAGEDLIFLGDPSELTDQDLMDDVVVIVDGP